MISPKLFVGSSIEEVQRAAVEWLSEGIRVTRVELTVSGNAGKTTFSVALNLWGSDTGEESAAQTLMLFQKRPSYSHDTKPDLDEQVAAWLAETPGEVIDSAISSTGKAGLVTHAIVQAVLCEPRS